MRPSRAWPLLLPVLLAACGAAETESGPGGVTVGEARALDEAADMLDSRRLPDGTLDELAEPATAPSTAAKAN
jgi:hypothetical protein